MSAMRIVMFVGSLTLLPCVQAAEPSKTPADKAIILTVDAKGRIGVGADTTLDSPAHLKAHLEKVYETERKSRSADDLKRLALTIRADGGAECKAVWEVMRICGESRFSRVSLRVGKGSDVAIARPKPIVSKDASVTDILKAELLEEPLEPPHIGILLRPDEKGPDFGRVREVAIMTWTLDRIPIVLDEKREAANPETALPPGGSVALLKALKRLREVEGKDASLWIKVSDGRLKWAAVVEVAEIARKAGFESLDLNPPADPEVDLTNDDISSDLDIPLNYKVDRLDDISVPGVVLPEERIGIPGAPEGSPRDIPPPPGLGTSGLDGGLTGSSKPGELFGTSVTPSLLVSVTAGKDGKRERIAVRVGEGKAVEFTGAKATEELSRHLQSLRRDRKDLSRVMFEGDSNLVYAECLQIVELCKKAGFSEVNLRIKQK